MVTKTPNVLSASTIMDDTVVNPAGEELGNIEELMIDLDGGRVSYAVLSFGGFLGLGDKLFAIPWEAFTLDPEEEVFVLDVNKETLENAPGFDEDDWPEHPTHEWMVEVYEYYGYTPYWI